ncbi:MAG: hypothetical protein UT50_C0002G0002 [Candidatus Moranbacteria bacterium GW2011_GWA2_39_41]|nr:MAG: hypothetical protein UT50_C0002G0002 [Candidatus Moranbacteria bacterium GW2011_GWA2_39_41]
MEKTKKEEKVTKTSIEKIFKDKKKMDSGVVKKKAVKTTRAVVRKEAKVEPEAKKVYVEQSVATETASEGILEKAKIWKKILPAVIIVVVIGILGGAGYYFYHKYKKAPVAVNENEDFTIKVGKMMELPNEAVTLATVTDKEKLKDQPFFANSENGDKALIYTQAKKAILYRPSTNKIIEVMYLSISQNATTSEVPVAENSAQNATSAPEQTQTALVDNSTAQEQVATEPVKVVVYNGTNTKGMAANMADKISVIEGVTIAEKTNAVGAYTTTIVVNLNGKDEAAQKIAEAVGGQVTKDLPDGEKSPEADILVIVGSDFVK